MLSASVLVWAHSVTFWTSGNVILKVYGIGLEVTILVQ
jgi:hypothetical protein